MKKFVYLAGPVLGQTEGQANDWRKTVAGLLEPHGIIGISPLRCEPIHGPTYQPGYPDERFGTARAIMNKNLFDVQNCDMTLAYIPRVNWEHWMLYDRMSDPPHHSWGTICELAWAKALGKSVILVTDDPPIREHPVLNASAGWVLDSLEEATDVLIGILGGYTGGKNV
jgi:nucleoside 2-deoxyribosyltransferase